MLQDRPDAQTADLARMIHRSSQRMIHLIEDLLPAAALEEGRLELHPRVVDLGQLAAAVVEDYRGRTASKQQTLELAAEEGCLVHADEGGPRSLW